MPVFTQFAHDAELTRIASRALKGEALDDADAVCVNSFLAWLEGFYAQNSVEHGLSALLNSTGETPLDLAAPYAG